MTERIWEKEKTQYPAPRCLRTAPPGFEDAQKVRRWRRPGDAPAPGETSATRGACSRRGRGQTAPGR